MSPNSGNPRDLALHRLTVAKEDLATARMILSASISEQLITGRIIQSITQLQQY